MPHHRRSHSELARFIVPACVAAQAMLLFTNPGLLPVWGDESFTLAAAASPLPELLRAYAGDVNPPLHGLLLHLWLKLPWPWGPATAARALSALIALLGTLAILRLWAEKEEAGARVWFAALWCFSPAVLLFARMARAYSLQVLLFTVALGAALGLLDQPRNPRRILAFGVCEALLLYTHYLPALALLGGLLLRTAWLALRQRARGPLAGLVIAASLAALLYSPWVVYLWGTLQRLGRATPPQVADNRVVSEALRLGCTFFSFSYGETPPSWVLAGGALLAPAVLWLVWKGLAVAPPWFWIVLPAAVAAYLGASRWVGFIFVPARLLFLLPFFLLLLARGVSRSGRAGAAAGGALLLLCAGSVGSYFRATDFLNKAYLSPYDEIARFIRQESGGRTAVVVGDACNLDPGPLLRQARPWARVVYVWSENRLEELRARALEGDPEIIWHLRNTRDTCPGGLNGSLGAELAKGRRQRQWLFVEYSERDKLILRALGMRSAPSHFLQLDEYSRF